MKNTLFIWKAVWLWPLLLAFKDVNSQALQRPVAGFGQGLLAYQKMNGHPLVITSNVAVLARTTQFSAGVCSERRFLMKDLGFHQIGFALPSKEGGLGGQLSYFGNTGYQELSVSAAYGRRLGERLDVGILFSHFRLGIAGTESASATTAGLGLRMHVSGSVVAGIQVFNPMQVTLQPEGSRLPAQYAAGLGWEVSPQLLIGMELFKIGSSPPGLGGGIRYHPHQQISAQCGLESGTGSPYISAGIALANFELITSGSLHPQLGLTPALQLTYRPLKSE